MKMELDLRGVWVRIYGWRLRTPIVYFVDSAAALKNDATWWERRHGVADIVVDLNGSILSADEVQSLTL